MYFVARLEHWRLINLHIIIIIIIIFFCFRWSIVIHGGIDGFSRTVIFLAASDNNKAATVLEQFKVAESHYGLPTRLRIDLGVENVQMAQYMAMKRADVVRPNPVLRGKSCHNQRIERLWVDVWKNVTNMYKDMFLLMEMNGDLNILDARCLWAFKFVFLPRLNASLAAFQQQWNHHGLSTEHGKSPSNLFVTGVLRVANSSSVAIRELFEGEDDVLSGVGEADVSSSENAETSGDDEVLAVEVPTEGGAEDTTQDHSCPVSAAVVQRVREEIDPLERKDDVLYGQTVFRKVISLLD